jgi:hypothetical protein
MRPQVLAIASSAFGQLRDDGEEASQGADFVR